MFSKALFKQTVKAHWARWVSVTVATCVMLAIVIIVLGNLGISDIRDSLKNVFVQADQESSVKEECVDSYELYLTTTDTYSQALSISNYMTLITQSYDGQISSIEQPTQEDKERIANSEAEKWINMMGATDPSMSEDKKLELKQFLSGLLLFHDANPTLQNLDLITSYYYDTVYNQAYTLSLDEGYTEEEAQERAQTSKQLAIDAIAYYEAENDTEGFTYNRSDFEEPATNYVNQLMYSNVYDMQIADGVAEDEAKQYAVAVKVISNTAITTYQFWIDDTTAGVTKDEAKAQACQSISDQIPEKVAEALSELGNMDIYGLIIGSIFYRIAGLLLPLVFVIMTANALLAGQVDSGSMAYVLSTPTKRRTVTVTQMLYLIFSLFCMYAVLTVVSVISVWVSGGNSFAINYGEILLLNLGAFLTMFAIAGFCFMCSAIFNRSKHSLSIGGGLSMFALVCTILGLFGSSVVPSAMRIPAMDFFNYLSIITFFDTVSILNGTLDFLWKFGALIAIGVVTIIIGIFRFDKKDLPL